VAYQFLVIAVMLSIIGFFVFSVVYVQVTPCDQAQEVCLGYSHMSDLTLAIGSLLGLLALRTLSSSGVLGSSEAWLVAYARRQEITKDWSVAMKSNNLRLGLLWVSSLTLRGVNLLQRKRVQGWWSPMELASVASFLVISLVFLSTIYGILHVCSCLGMLIDSYVSHFDQEDFRLETSVYEWNLLQAVLRKVSNSVEKSFLVVQTTSLALVLLAASQLYRGEAGSLTTLGIASTSLLVFGVMFVFFKASEVSERCMRMPALINSLHFGKHVDTKRHYLVEFVTYSHAGFYVGEVRLTTAIALKLTYFAGAIAFAGLSQLYYTNDSS
jgi:hypothetical protein